MSEVSWEGCLLDRRRQGQGGVNVCGVSEVSWEGDLLDREASWGKVGAGLLGWEASWGKVGVGLLDRRRLGQGWYWLFSFLICSPLG